MHPEFVVIDGAFEMNRKKRSLLTGTGYDSEKIIHRFSLFHTIQRKLVYSWEIGKAISFLVGKSIRYNQVLICDMEQALVDAIIESINNPTSLLIASKLQIDYYRVFEQN